MNEELIKLYVKGMSIKQIAIENNVPETSLYRYLKKNNVKIRTNKQYNRKYTDEDLASIKSRADNGEEIGSIARSFGVTISAISVLMKRKGLR